MTAPDPRWDEVRTLRLQSDKLIAEGDASASWVAAQAAILASNLRAEEKYLALSLVGSGLDLATARDRVVVAQLIRELADEVARLRERVAELEGSGR